MNAVQGITSVPDAWEEQARELIPAYILYEPDYYTGIREGICSRCGHRFSGEKKRLEYPGDAEFRRGRHGTVLDCPGCGARAVMKARGRFRNMKSLAGNVRAVFCEAVTPKKVRLRAFYIEWGFPDYKAVRPDLYFHEDFFMDLEPGKAAAWRKVAWTADNWQSCGIREPWPVRDALNPNKVMGYTIFLDGLEGTFLGYLPFEEIVSYDWDRYTAYGNLVDSMPWCKLLAVCARYPQMEMVAKLRGAQIFTAMVLDGQKYARYLDWSARRITDFLRIPRQYAREAARDGLDIDTIMMVRDLGADYAEARRWRELGWTGKDAREAGAEAIRYLVRQHYRAEGFGILRDYRDACRELGRDLTVPGIRWPKDLRTAHDEAVSSAEAVRKEADRRDYERRYLEYRRRFEWESGEYMAIVPERLSDIPLEGRLQKHCVAGYTDRHAAGKLAILFIRRVACPMMPVWTAELTPEGELKQIQGYHNEIENKPKGKDMEWVDAWLREVRRRVAREKKEI